MSITRVERLSAPVTVQDRAGDFHADVLGTELVREMAMRPSEIQTAAAW